MPCYQFSDLTGTYALNYSYNLANELTSLSIPFTSQTIGYNYDTAARLSSVSASGFSATYNSGWPNYQNYTQPVTSFISSIAYRAWGAAKNVTYGNTVSESMTSNARMQPTSYTLNNVNYTNYNVYPSQSFTSMSWTFDYYADGRVNHAYDSTWNFWDRSFSYDHAGRLAEADSNRVAHGLSWDFWHPDPYQQTSNYDVWNNLKLTGYQYNFSQTDSATYTNNRRSDSSYDANGNVTSNLAYNNSIDVASQNTHATSHQMVGDGSAQWPQQPASEITQTYEANGRPCKRTEVTRQDDRDLETGEFLGVSEDTLVHHYIYSSVLGAQVVDLDQYGQANVWVYAGGQRIATTSWGSVNFEHHNPMTTSRLTTNGHSGSRATVRTERDPQTGPVPLTNPGGAYSAAQNWNQPLAFIGGDPSDFMPGVTLDGMPVTRADFARMGDAGALQTEYPGIWVNGKTGPHPVTQPVIPLGLGMFGIYLPDDSRGNDRTWGLYLFGPILLSQGTRAPQKPKPTPTPKTPCWEQDFTFSEGANGLTADELGMIAQVAVGESTSDGTFYANEASTVIDTIENRLSSNLWGAANSWRSVATDGSIYDIKRFAGGAITVAGILGEYDALTPTGKDNLRSGERKLAQEKKKNNGVLPADSFVCKQLLEARGNASRVGDAISHPGEFLVNGGVNSNRGSRARLPSNFTLMFTIGNTRFGMIPYLTRRP